MAFHNRVNVGIHMRGAFAIIATGGDQEGLMRRRSLLAGTVAAAVVASAVPATASADTVTIGSNLQRSYDVAAVSTGISLQRTLAAPTLSLTSPVNGQITSWSVRSGDMGALYTLRVLRSLGGLSYQATGSSAAPSPIPAATDTIYPYPASLPISQGNAVGIQVGGTGVGAPLHTGDPTDQIAYGPALADGGSANFSDTGGSPYELLLQATVKYCIVPSLKRLKTKPAKQALRAHDCLPKIKKSKIKKNRFRGKVLKQKTPPGTTAAPGTVVPIVIGKKI
jgi:uncharacterized membrane protein